MTTDERALGKLATHMDAAERAVLLGAMRPIEVDAGTVVVRDGQPLAALFVVVSGRLDLSIDASGRSVPLGRVSPGAFIGELAVLGNGVAAATATAGEKSRLLEFTGRDLDALRASDTRVASLLLRSLVEDLAERVRAANTVADAGDDVSAKKEKGWLEGVLAKLFGGGNA